MDSSFVGFRFMLLLPIGCAAVLLLGGCACYQGYLLGRPAATREFTEMALELGGL